MKTICRPLIKGTNWALAGLLSLLGFSCTDNVAPEYGTPHARYSVKGSVTDTAGTLVPGIEILIKTENGGPVRNEPAYTSGQGKFDVAYDAFPNEKFILTATDVDGEANGSFKTDSVEVVFNKEDFYEKGDGHWYDGAAKKELPPIVLKEEVKEADE
jgi:putative lipoprotein (rSAM/lipoprotein system)